MRRRLPKYGLLLLVLALVLGSVTSCTREAESRESGTLEEVAEGATPTGSLEMTPAATVVSVATSSLGTPMPATPGSENTTPVAVDTMETDVPASAVVEPAEPPPTEAPASQPASSGSGGDVVNHTVKKGETLAKIADRYGTSVSAIVRANGLRNANQIYVGQKLKIPKTGGSTGGSSGKCRVRHNVKAGEWVWQIARDYDVSPYKILSANGMTIKSANNIQPGTVLCIP
jgi:LysM repeat protein